MLKQLIKFALLCLSILLQQHVSAQDRLLFANGTEQLGYIQKDSAGIIYFSKAQSDTTMFTASKSDLKQIVYANRDQVLFSAKDARLVQMDEPGTENSVRVGKYKCWTYVDSVGTRRKQRGYIQSVADSGINFTVSGKRNSFVIREESKMYINAVAIDKLKIRREGAVGRGMLIGAGVGFVVGGLLGYAYIPNYGIFITPPRGENALAGACIWAIPGSIIGALAGTFRVTIPIHKNQELYKSQKGWISSYTNRKR
jgi:hypothetical protein